MIIDYRENQDMPEKEMLALELGGFGSLCSPLQKTALDRLLPSAASIQKLEISRMFHMTESDR